MTETGVYRVEQTLVLEPEMHHQPIKPALLSVAGLSEDTPPDQLLLAQLKIFGARYGGNWHVNVSVGDIVVGSMWCAPGTARDAVLGVASDWIRASKHIVFMPGSVYEIPSQNPDEVPYVVQGITLVRGDRC